MMAHSLVRLWPLLADAAIKGAILLLLACAAVLFLRRRPAALRHLVWSLAFAGLLAMPLLSAVMPQWQILPRFRAQRPVAAQRVLPPNTKAETPALTPAVTLPVPNSQTETPHEDHQQAVVASTGVQRHAPVATTAPARAPFQWRSLIPFAMLIWITGFAATLVPILIGRIALWRFGRGAQVLSDGLWLQEYNEARGLIRLRRRVRLLKAGADNMPMAWGIIRPHIALPSAEKWAGEERRAVLLHELAHVKRWDMLTQTIAHIACALHWFNPLVWLARRRMTADRESACDDLVLHAGVRPSLYAEQLLAVARDLRANSFHAAAIAMARPSKLAGRVEAVLNDQQQRRLTAKLLCLCLPIILAAVVAVACTATPAQGTPIPMQTLKENFRADPSWLNAVALMNTFTFRKLSQEEGNEIIRLLSHSEIIVRSSYAAGKPIVVRVKDHTYKLGASDLTFMGYEWEYVATATLDGAQIGSCLLSRNGFGSMPISAHWRNSKDLVIQPQSAGEHNLSVQIEWKLWPLEGKPVKTDYIRPDWDGPPPNAPVVLGKTADKTKPPKYSVKFDLPLVIDVVPQGEQEQVALVTNKNLDAAVQRAFQFAEYPSATKNEAVKISSSRTLIFNRPPVDLVMNWQLVNEEGKPYESEGTYRIIVRSGQETTAGLMVPFPLSQYPLGLNRCKLIFTPDPEAAISEPDIKEIWGGTVEVPVEFTVSKVEANAATPVQGAPIPLETLKENFENSPSERNAIALMNVLTFRKPSKEEANEVLKLVTQAHVISRSSYAEGKSIPIQFKDYISKGSPTVFVGYAWEFFMSATLDGKDMGYYRRRDSPGTNSSVSGGAGERMTLPPQSVGDHNFLVHVEWKLWPLQGTPSRSEFSRPDWQGPYPNDMVVRKGTADITEPPKHSVSFNVPYVIKVVPAGEEEKIALVTNADLDAAVNAAFQFREDAICNIGDRRIDASRMLELIRPPINLAMKYHLVNEEGKAYPSEATIIVRPEQTTNGLFVPGNFSQYPLGLNRCKLVFTPDPDAAYKELDIKEIWGGTVEIPVEFTVSEIEPPKTSEQSKATADTAPVDIRLIPPPGMAIPKTAEMSFEITSLPLNPDTDARRRWSSSNSMILPWQNKSYDIPWGRLYAYVRIVGFAPTFVGPIEHTPEAPCKQLDVPLKLGHTAKLRLIPNQGAPPDKGNVEVRISKINGQDLGYPILFRAGHGHFPVGDQGRVIITDLPDDAVVSVTLCLTGFEENTFPDIHLDPARPAEIVLKRATPATGRILDADGNPLKDVMIRRLGSRGPDEHAESGSGGWMLAGTDANGVFSLNSLRSGGWKYWFIIEDKRCEAKTIGPVQAGDDLGDITMGRPIVLSGQVVSPTGNVSSIQFQQPGVAGFALPKLAVLVYSRETDAGRSFQIKGSLCRGPATIQIWFESPRPQKELRAVPGNAPDGKVTRYLDPDTGTVIQLDYETELKDSLTGLYITTEGVEIKP